MGPIAFLGPECAEYSQAWLRIGSETFEIVGCLVATLDWLELVCRDFGNGRCLRPRVGGNVPPFVS